MRYPDRLSWEADCRLEGAAEAANVDRVVAAVVGEGLATLCEMQTVYSYEDALDLAEIIGVRRYNEWAAAKEARKRNGGS